MATKKDKICLSDKQQFFVNADSHDKNQYSNFNLNGNYSYSSISSSVQSHSKTKTSNINSFDSHDIGNNEGKKKLQTSIKSSYGFAEEQVQKLFEDRQGQNLSQQHNSSNVNNSTLSLHIAAYENSLETSDERSDEEEEVSKKKSTGFLQKWQNAKQIFTDSKAINQNPFEFPRQQEQYEIPPEVMQFIASQNVLNPNEMDAKTEDNGKMFDALNKLMTSEKQAYGFITANGQDNFNVYVVDSVTEKRVTVFQYHADEAEEFKAEIPKIEKFFKSFIIDLFELLLLSTPYQISYQFCEELKKDFEACEISSYFVSKENYHFSSLLIAANLDLKLDEKVYLILHHERHGDQPDNIFGITVGEYKFTPIGYQQISKKDLTALNSEEAPEILCQKICGTKKPKHVVTASFGDRENPLENVFDEKDLTLFQNCCFGCQFDKYIIETSKWIFDKTLIKNHVLPTSVKGIHVKGNYGTETNILDIMKVEVNDLLPIKKTAIVPRSIPELQVVLQTQFFTKTCIPDHLRNDCQRYQITLTVNEENFEVVRVDEMEIEDFEDLLEKIESKIPFIGFIDNSSVVAVYKPEEEQYEILDEWNGLYGSDCFISFDEERPKFGDEAKDMLATKNTSVVFDLLKIMSMAPEDIKTEKTWGFSFTRDITNPILVKFDNFDGKKKMSTPSFLMALFLKQHLKVIKEETGEKPKEVALWIFKQDFDEVQMKRIKDGLEEACKLIKIDCSFVDSGDFEVNFIKTDSTKLTY